MLDIEEGVIYSRVSRQRQVSEGNGGARRDRTADLNTASVALSQLSYSPNKERRNNQTICNVNIITLAQIFLVT